jgi:hypothetical protein
MLRGALTFIGANTIIRSKNEQLIGATRTRPDPSARKRHPTALAHIAGH